MTRSDALEVISNQQGCVYQRAQQRLMSVGIHPKDFGFICQHSSSLVPRENWSVLSQERHRGDGMVISTRKKRLPHGDGTIGSHQMGRTKRGEV